LANPNRKFQRAAFRILSDEEKSTLWKQHLIMLLPKFENSPKKHDFINEIINNMRPEMFSKDNQQFDAQISKYEYRAANLFSNNENVMLFYSLNPKLVGNIQVSFKLMNSSQSKQSVALEENSGKDCTCNADGDPNHCTDSWTGGYTYCAANQSGCTTLSTGCGWWWQNRCNGDCKTVLYL
jgi:hypothetical protein